MNILRFRSKYPIQPYSIVDYKEHNRWYTGEAISFPCYDGTIMVRRVRGDPGSMIECHLDDVRRHSFWRTLAQARIILPWQNLGCLGFSYRNFYVDIFYKPYFGLYCSVRGRWQKWYKLPTFELLRSYWS